MEAIYIPPDSQKELICLARQTLESFVLGKGGEAEKTCDPQLLSANYGAFVSLHKGDELRGCIGTCFPTRPLYQTVIEMTQAAASRDYRVSPIDANELAEICIEISVLSPLQVVRDPLSLEVGKHGLHIASGENRGVLLPQVASRYGWDIKTFLCQTCLKAGLPKNAWKWPETKIMAFTALIIEEER
ncbi:MAG: AmmeMemoRadiSam system protein A [Deltaproteobacteria bacterium]|nr:AmmeMemoRadiSam system protein A [Deltaproteobacteria bacterium]